MSNKKRERISISYLVPDGSIAVDVLKTRRASIQLFEDRRLVVIDGPNSWTYDYAWRIARTRK